MKRFVILLTISWICALFILPANTIHACSCVPSPPPKEALENSSVVFSGKVMEIKEPEPKKIMSSADPVTATIEVKEVWKGELGFTAQVSTAMSSASCGYYFDKGHEYIVYAHGDMEDLRVSLCSRTAPLSMATEDLQELGEGIINPEYGKAAEELKEDSTGNLKGNETDRMDTVQEDSEKNGSSVLIWIISSIIGVPFLAWIGIKLVKRS